LAANERMKISVFPDIIRCCPNQTVVTATTEISIPKADSLESFTGTSLLAAKN
jgi:hypothetical protein